MRKVRVYSAFDPPPEDETNTVRCTQEEKRTVEDTTRATDLAYQLRHLHSVSVLPVVGREGVYSDVSEIGDFRQALETVRAAEEMFMMQPAALRERFKNDPQELLAFVMDDANKAEAIELGLIEAPPALPAVIPPKPA